MSEPRGRVLLAEDSLVGQRVGVAMLEHLGLGVDVVADGELAVRAAAETTFDLILMDCQMPVLDGYAAAVAIRDASPEHVPIIAVTADPTAEDRLRCHAAGMDDCLGKPLRIDTLSALVDRWLPVDATVLDAGVVEGLARLGETVVGQLAGMFLTELPARSDAIRTAVATGDGPALALAAHTLAGSSASLGAAELARRCAALERDGTAGRLAAVEGELGRVCVALRALAPA